MTSHASICESFPLLRPFFTHTSSHDFPPPLFFFYFAPLLLLLVPHSLPRTPEFGMSDQSEAAYQLLSVDLDTNDPNEVLKQLVRTPAFQYIAAPVASLARNLSLTAEDIIVLQDLQRARQANLEGAPVMRLEDLISEAEMGDEKLQASAAQQQSDFKESDQDEAAVAEDMREIQANLSNLMSTVNQASREDDFVTPVLDRDGETSAPPVSAAGEVVEEEKSNERSPSSSAPASAAAEEEEELDLS